MDRRRIHLGLAGLLLTAGSTGERFGRRRALCFGLAVFAAGSVWAPLSGPRTP
jgi:MFS family permease